MRATTKEGAVAKIVQEADNREYKSGRVDVVKSS